MGILQKLEIKAAGGRMTILQILSLCNAENDTIKRFLEEFKKK